MKHVDLLIIGSGPAGQKAAIQAAKLGKSVIVIERNNYLGGTCTHTGTIPSKALREAVLHLLGLRQRSVMSGAEFDSRRPAVTMSELITRGLEVIRVETGVIFEQMRRNCVDVVFGQATFVDPHTVEIRHDDTIEQVSADFVLVATGTRPSKPPGLPFDGHRVLDSDDLLRIPQLPKSIIIVGGGVIGTEYACMMAMLGLRVILVEARNQLLDFVDSEIGEALQYRMRSMDVTLRLNERVDDIQVLEDGLVQAKLQSGKHLRSEALLYCIGRQGNTDTIGLDKVGLTPDNRGRIKVNENYQTEIPHIYAAGDVIGFPALASTSMEQGRRSSCHAFGEPTTSIPELFPLGIYTIPEISMVGRTEEKLTEDNVPYEAGIAQYKEIARGQILGDEVGMLKLLIHEETRQILGVHAIGTGATELIHIGQAVMAFHGTVDYFINNVFNYPTLAECYKVAALNGANKLRLLHKTNGN